jgi:hypothetical protein
MEQAPRARARKADEAVVNADRKPERPNHRVKAVWELTEVKAGDQAEVAAGVRVKAKAPDRVAADSLNQLTNQPINELTN